MWILFHSQSISQLACHKTRLRALKITQNNRLLCWIYETVLLKIIFLLCHGDSFTLLSSLSIGMGKQFV